MKSIPLLGLIILTFAALTLSAKDSDVPLDISASGVRPYGWMPIVRIIEPSREDNIDSMPVNEQAAAYRSLYADLESGNTPRSTLNRLSLKIELAAKRVHSASPSFAEKTVFCKTAAEIGATYLDENDPIRALKWEQITLGILENNASARVLRDSIRAWQQARLEMSLNTGDWITARSTIVDWERLMPGDASIERGKLAYGKIRAAAIKTRLLSEGADAALDVLRQEKDIFSDLPNWEAMTSEAIRTLQEPFESAISNRKVKDAEALLEKQRDLSDRYQLAESILPLLSNMERLDDLKLALLPGPLHRDYGMVIANRLRLEVSGGFGDMIFKGETDNIESSYVMPSLEIGYRQYQSNRLGWWYGGRTNIRAYSASESTLEADGYVIGLSGIFGWRNARGVACAGLGLSIYDLSFLGKASDDNTSGTNIGQLYLNGEYAFGLRWSLYATLDAGYNSEYSDVAFIAGGRYYIGNNVSIGVQFGASSIAAKNKDDNDQRIRASILSAGPTALVQF
ncbi:MAG: hypothetical protein ABIH86_01180 [Planctomycetota bacterium]